MKPAVPYHPHHLRPDAIRLTIAIIAVLLTVLTQWMALPTRSFFADEWLRDHFVKLQTTDAPDPRILVVDIDEASLASEGIWPWPHDRLADLVETLLTSYSARGVALDIVLPKAGNAGEDDRLGLLAQHGPLVLAQALAPGQSEEGLVH